MRFFHLVIKPEYLALLPPFHEKIVLPALQKTRGCLFAGLIQSSNTANECVSLTLWESKELAEAYEKSKAFRLLMKKLTPYLSDSAEWKIHLSEDLELKYEPVRTEPVLRDYQVIAGKDAELVTKTTGKPLYVRLVSIKLQEGKLEEFRRKYSREIVPALQSTPGCRYIYLTENLHDENDLISLTIWDSKEDADAYEKSGLFAKLVDRVDDLFSQFYQWKVALEKDRGGKVKTSEDMKIDYYAMVSGKKFH